MGESKTMKRIRVLHSELNGELGGIESFLYNVYRFIDRLLLDTTIIQKKKRLIQKLNCFTICRLSH